MYMYIFEYIIVNTHKITIKLKFARINLLLKKKRLPRIEHVCVYV